MYPSPPLPLGRAVSLNVLVTHHIAIASFFGDSKRLLLAVAYCPFELGQSADGGGNGASKRILPTLINPRGSAVRACALRHAYHV